MSESVLVGYSTVFQTEKPTEADLTDILKNFHLENTFGFLTMISNLLALFPTTFDETKSAEIHLLLSSSLLTRQQQKLVSKDFPEIPPLPRSIFNRWQVLFLMKKLLQHATNDGLQDPNLGDDPTSRYHLGTTCLIANDLFVDVEQERRMEELDPSKYGNSERVLDELLTQLISTTELFNPPEISRALARNLLYIEISESDDFSTSINGVSLSELFAKTTGLSLRKFLEMVVAVYASLITKSPEDLIDNPANFNIRRDGYFANLNYEKEELEAFFRLMSISISELQQKLATLDTTQGLKDIYDFTLFRQFPLLNISVDILTPIDVSLLTEKVTSGLYHTVFTAIRNAGFDPSDFFQVWGKIFERYVNSIFAKVYPPLTNRFYPNTYFDTRTEREAFDGIVEYPSALVVMEYKGGTLNARAKYSGEVGQLLDDIDRKFGVGRKDSGINQLVTKIQLLFDSDPNKRLTIRNLAFPYVRMIYPVLIVNDLSLQFGLANWKLKTSFDQARLELQLSPEIDVGRLLVLTIEDLEVIAPHLEAEDFTLFDFVSYYSQQEYIRYSHWLTYDHWFHPMVTVRDTLRRFLHERKLDHRNDTWLSEKFEIFIDQIKSSFRVA